MWRFNLGAGSAEQGAGSGIKDEWRRAESFLKPDGSYDFTRLAGQRWFLQAAQQQGVRQFLGFLNSPPVALTINDKAHADKDQTNLAPANYAALGTYCATVVAGVRQATGITFDYLSPINEPQWDWSGDGQEDSPFRNAEITRVAKALSAALVAKKLPTQVLVTEAGKLTYLTETADKPGRGDQLGAFFGNKAAPAYLGSTPQVAPIIDGHSYFTTSPAVRPGAVRLTAAMADSAGGNQPLVSAYRSPNGKQLITIVVNDHDAPATVRLELAGRQRLGAGRPYITSATASLQPGPALAAGQPLVVAPRSITTLVSELR